MEKSKIPKAELKMKFIRDGKIYMTVTQYALRSAEWLKKRVFH